MSAGLGRALAALLLAGAGGAAAAQAPGAAAIVNGVGVPRQRLERFIEPYAASRGRSIANLRNPSGYKVLLREALELLVDEELLAQEAARRGLAAGSAEVEAALAEVRGRFQVPGAFEARLAAEGLRQADLAADLQRQLSIRRLVDEVVAPTIRVEDAEIHAIYQADPERFRRPPPPGAGQADAGQLAPEAEVRELIRERVRTERIEAAVRAQAAALRPGAEIRLLLP